MTIELIDLLIIVSTAVIAIVGIMLTIVLVRVFHTLGTVNRASDVAEKVMDACAILDKVPLKNIRKVTDKIPIKKKK